MSITIEKLVFGFEEEVIIPGKYCRAGAPVKSCFALGCAWMRLGTFPARRGLEPTKIVARSNHNKLQYGGRRLIYLSFGPGKFSHFSAD